MHLSISIENILDITASKFIELLIPRKYNDGDLCTTQHRKLKSLFEKPILALEKRYLARSVISSQRLFVRLYCDHP